MSDSKDMDPSIYCFITRLNELFSAETYNYSFYDFERLEIKDNDKIYSIIQDIKNNKNSIKLFCDEINKNFSDYEITNIENIRCGTSYKKSKRDSLTQIPNGYYYRFTVICKKRIKI